MNPIVLVIVLVIVVVIAFAGLIGSRGRRENPMRSLGEMGMRGVNQDEIVQLLTRKQKIEAIKRYREMTGVGLAQAKAVVEQMERELLMGPQVAMGVQPFMGVAENLTDQDVRAELFEAEMQQQRVSGIAGNMAGLDESVELFAAELQQLLLAGNKIGAIKLYRERTGASLAEAKAAIDRIV